MDKFLALTEEKRLTILNAALQCFGKFGYEKASINDIAVAAHISKASVFQYFGKFQNTALHSPIYFQRLGGNFSRCTGFAGHPDGRNLQVQKRYDFAGR